MVAPRTITGRGVVKGQPRRFVSGHQLAAAWAARPRKFRLSIVKVRGRKLMPFCRCGCGGRVATRKSRFVKGHAPPRRVLPATADRWVLEDRGYVTPCKVWTGGLDHWGYGRIRRDGRDLGAHRVAFEQHVGPVPAGHDVHHKCEVKACVEPSHLQPLTPEEHGQLHGRVWRRAAC